MTDVTIPAADRGSGADQRQGGETGRSTNGRIAALASYVSRDDQLACLIDHFQLSVEQADAMLGCTANTIYNRRSRRAPARHTALDDRIDAAFYIATMLETLGFAPTTVRDWLFSRSRYFDGETPSALIARGQYRLALEAGRCFLSGHSTQDFRHHVAEIGLLEDDGGPSVASVYRLPESA